MQYDVTDLNLAGFLVASSIPLKSNRTENGQTIFCFSKTDKLVELVEDYYNMRALVNPLSYGSALKVLKNIIHQKNHNYNYANSRMFNESGKAR